MSQTRDPSPPRSWRASGVVSFTTDFGLSDPYVGMMKAVVLSRSAERGAVSPPTLVDVTHGIPPQAVGVGALVLNHAYAYFPEGSVHVAVVDPGVGTERKLLVAEHKGHAFLAPDNGLLSRILDASSAVWELDVARFALSGSSRTFHGRDVLAPAAAAIARGMSPSSAGRERVSTWVSARIAEPVRDARGVIQGEILLVDRYGNLISNVDADMVARLGPRRELCIASERIDVRTTYGDAERGTLVALINSYGLLEIAVRDGSASDRLRAAPGARITVEST